MKKIAILGCENSHANSFIKYVKEKEEFNDIEVVGVYSSYVNSAQKLSDTFGVPVMQSFDELVGKVDGVINTARHGAEHYKFLAPYIKSGAVMFIDKPITIKSAEAVKFMRELKENGVKFTGGSSVIHDKLVQELKNDVKNNVDGVTKNGVVRAPISMANEYGGFYFYSQHIVEVMLEIFGRNPKTVEVIRTENGEFKQGETFTIVFGYENYNTVAVACDGNYEYYALRLAENGTKGGVIFNNCMEDCFTTEFRKFHDLLNGNEQEITHDDFIAPVFVMNAIYKSMYSGKKEVVEYEKV